MARGVNKVILVGNLGADPETRAMPSGSTVANLRIATSESWRDKTSGEQAGAHRVAPRRAVRPAGGKSPASICVRGSQVYIEGSLRTRKWQDKQGNERFSTEIVGNELQMLGGRGGGAGGAGGGGRRWRVAAPLARPTAVAEVVAGAGGAGGGRGAPPGFLSRVRRPGRARAVRRTISTTIFRSDRPERDLGRTPRRAWAGSHPIDISGKVGSVAAPGGDSRAVRRVRP